MNKVDKSQDKLVSVLKSLENLTKKQVSLKFILLRGAVYGIGTVIGATVLISVASYLFATIFGIELFNIDVLQDMRAATKASVVN